jgi:NAD(P)H-dependent flavin oxidoreductase YrpB (nitropropane dioxygenase family)
VEWWGWFSFLIYIKATKIDLWQKGWALARAHAKAGDPWTISGYLGRNNLFEVAMEKFALAYADQAEQDQAAVKVAVRAGIIDVIMER